jgi:hypothetical protein
MDTTDEDNEDQSKLHLPNYINTLKRQVRSHLPMLRLLRRPITVTLEKQATLAAYEKGKSTRITIIWQTWHYWYDPVDLVTKILSASKLTAKMHFGLAKYVNSPSELWHSRAWGSSTLTTSGEFACVLDGAIILPGDIVRLTGPVEGYSKGRVVFVRTEHRSQANRVAPEGEIVLSI